MKINKDMRLLAIERIKVMPKYLKLFFGDKKLDKRNMINEINRKTDLGNEIVEAHIDYLRSLKNGVTA